MELSKVWMIFGYTIGSKVLSTMIKTSLEQKEIDENLLNAIPQCLSSVLHSNWSDGYYYYQKQL